MSSSLSTAAFRKVEEKLHSDTKMSKSWIPAPLMIVPLLVCCMLPWGCCRSGGAPEEACGTLAPDPSQHGAGPQTSPVPYQVVLDNLMDDDGGLSYVPGETYTCKLLMLDV